MKKIILCFIVLISASSYAQDSRFVGSWEGKIDVSVMLRLIFHIEKSGSVFSTKMDSPDQKAFGIQTETTVISGDSINISMPSYGIAFSGVLKGDSISGEFVQGIAFPLTLKKVQQAKSTSRPQTPVPPFPYNTEDITFPSVNGIAMAGTITSPKTPGSPGIFPAILLITGSGPQNRDHEILGHKPFAVLADHFTKKGFLVLRVDDRGVGKSTGSFKGSTSEDFAMDANAAIDYLRTRADVDKERIGLIGHSEGGLIAPLVASQRKDIDFIVMLAGPGIKVLDLMTEQNIAVLNSTGMDKADQDAYGNLYKKIAKAIVDKNDSASATNAGRKVLNKWLKGKNNEQLTRLGLLPEANREPFVASMVNALHDPWFKWFMKYDPAPALKKVNAKVLAINGEKDIQVLSKSNLKGIEAALKKSKSPAPFVVEMPGLNHLFQECITCTIKEYGELQQSFSPAALELVSEWLKKHVQ